MAKSDEVERWFAETRPPSEKAMRRVRDIIVAADRRISEYVKYGTIQFKSDAGDFANFVQVKRAGVNLMLMRGGRLKGRYPHLEGGAHRDGEGVVRSADRRLIGPLISTAPDHRQHPWAGQKLSAVPSLSRKPARLGPRSKAMVQHTTSSHPDTAAHQVVSSSRSPSIRASTRFRTTPITSTSRVASSGVPAVSRSLSAST